MRARIATIMALLASRRSTRARSGLRPPIPLSDAERVPTLVLDHVQLAAPPGCEAAARRFYGELLGLTEIEKPTALQARGGVWFALGDGRQLHIGVEDRFAAAARPIRRCVPATRQRCARLPHD